MTGGLTVLLVHLLLLLSTDANPTPAPVPTPGTTTTNTTITVTPTNNETATGKSEIGTATILNTTESTATDYNVTGLTGNMTTNSSGDGIDNVTTASITAATSAEDTPVPVPATDPPQTPASNPRQGVIDGVGALLGVLAAALFVVAGYMAYKQFFPPSVLSTDIERDAVDDEEMCIAPKPRSRLSTLRSASLSSTEGEFPIQPDPSISNPIPVTFLVHYVTGKKAEPRGFRGEYNVMPAQNLGRMKAAMRWENRGKDRFTDIRAYDHSRVILRDNKKYGTDYINANYIMGYTKPDERIETDDTDGGDSGVVCLNKSNAIDDEAFESRSRDLDMKETTPLAENKASSSTSVDVSKYCIRKSAEEIPMKECTPKSLAPARHQDVTRVPSIEVAKYCIRRNQSSGSLTQGLDTAKAKDYETKSDGDASEDDKKEEMPSRELSGTYPMRKGSKRRSGGGLRGSAARRRSVSSGESEEAERPLSVVIDECQYMDEDAHSINITATTNNTRDAKKTDRKDAKSKEDDTDGRTKDDTLPSVMDTFTSDIPMEDLREKESTDLGNTINTILNGMGPKCRDPNAKNYIATQGPTKNTVRDFWKMVWQEDVNRIVMTTNLVENEKEKCERYWPDEGRMEIEDFSIEFARQEVHDGFIVRDFAVSHEDVVRIVRHFHFTGWPDHDVPDYVAPLLLFRQKVREYDNKAHGPMVVHCSAGVGRSGTFIAIDYLLEQAKYEGRIDVLRFTMYMRTCRVSMIQTLSQYVFVHDALVEALNPTQHTIPCEDFKGVYDYLRIRDMATDRTQLQEQFQVLAATRPQANLMKGGLIGLKHANTFKNRSQAVVPRNNKRVSLIAETKASSDYINAVYLDGLEKQQAYIMTQYPLEDTMTDFWQMLWEQNTHAIVLLRLVDDIEPGVESLQDYWPNEEEPIRVFGSQTTKHISQEKLSEDLTLRQIMLTTDKESEERIVKQYVITWYDEEEPVSSLITPILQVIDLVDEWQQAIDSGPLVVQCEDGASLSGIYCTASLVVERIQLEQEVDVYQAVKQVRAARPSAIQDHEQYQMLYNLALEYTESSENYGNFR